MSQPVPITHLYLVDGSGFIFRAFHALPPMTRADGTPVNAVYGFVSMMMKLLAEHKAEHLAVIFDASEHTFRNEIYPEYKAQRPPPPEELVPQFALVRDATRAMGTPAIELPGYEADDLIASYAREAVALGAKVTIVSSDKDLMQLVRDGVEMYDPMKSRIIGPDEVFERFGVAPDRVVDVQALAGDAVDNVPGVPGIGVKTAAQLINAFGDLETLLARLDEIPQPKRRETLQANIEKARISKRLVLLKDDVELPLPLSEMTAHAPERGLLLGFLDQMGFRSLKTRAQGMDMVDSAEQAVEQPLIPAADRGPAHYELVLTEPELHRWIAEAAQAGRVAISVETDAPNNPFRSRLTGIALAVKPGRACYIPVLHTREQPMLDLAGPPPDAPPAILPEELVIARLKPLLEDPAVLKVGHDIKPALQVLARSGILAGPIEDTMLLSYVLDGSGHGHGIDELAERFLDHKTTSLVDICGTGKKALTFDQVPLDKALAYAAENAEVTLRLAHALKPRLLAERMVTVYETMDRPLLPILAGMERTGILVDRRELAQMSAEFGDRMIELEKKIRESSGTDFNPGSPKQLGEVLFDKLNLPGGKKNKTGAYGTGADVLEALAPLHELPRLVLDWRQISKLKSTYADALANEVHPDTGRIHTTYAMAVASTGRLSSNAPNLQNIPIRTEEGRRIRRAFVAAPGHLLLSADYSQIELRLVAHVADIGKLKQAFHDGADIHAITASEVFGVPVEGMDPMMRRRAKAINFGIIYGISAFGLANQLAIPQGEAKAFIEAYFARYPEIRDYMEAVKQEARVKGHVMTPFGRKCYIPGIADKNPAMRSFSERAAINAPIQGGAADIIKRAMIHLPRALTKAGLSARMLLQVHDELVFEVPEAELDATATLARDVMESAATISVPLVVETGHARSWAEAH